MKKLIFSLFFLLNITYLIGQPVALKKFLDTEFIHEFDSIRTRAHKSVRDFKAIQHLYAPEDVQRVAESYNAAAGLFNAGLFNIKNDLLLKDKRKYILKYPEDYSKQMMADLYQAKEYYENDYGLVLDEVTEGKVDNIFPFAAVATVFNLAKKGMAIFKKFKDQWDGLNENMLNKFLIEKHSFQKWEDIR